MVTWGRQAQFPGFHLSSPPALVGADGTFGRGIREREGAFSRLGGGFQGQCGLEWRGRDIPEAAVCTGGDGGAV